MDTTKFQKFIRELKAGPQPDEISDDDAAEFGFPDPEEMIEDGADPQFVLYSTVQVQLLTMAAMLEQSGIVDEYHEILESALDTYMPGFPPMSPVTDSFFHSWALCDLTFGDDGDNIGRIAADMIAEMGMPTELKDLCGKLLNSRMGIYETIDIDCDLIVVRELVTGHELLVDVPTGYFGAEGELRFVRLGPPAVHDAEYFTELTTPYILEGRSAAEWTSYLKSVMPDSVLSDDGSPSTLIEDRLASVFKEDCGEMPWLEFVFQGYRGYEEDVIYLTGIPNEPASLPHSDSTVATNSKIGIDRKLMEQAKALGITILPPDAVHDGDIEISLTDAQRQAAAELLPDQHADFKPETKGRKQISLPVDQWEKLRQQVEKQLMAENGHGRTRFRNLRKAVDSALSEAEFAHQSSALPKLAAPPKLTASTKPQTIYRLRVDLRGVKPPIWRRIEVPDCTLAELHIAIQAAMGWTDSHLHAFDIDGDHYSIPNPFGDDDFEVIDSTDMWLSDVIYGKGMKLDYMYDFGDSWDHTIKVEAIEQAKPSIAYPRCVTGKRNCPPEDCGGIWGYEELLEILADPKHPEYEYRIDWCGEFDSEEFDAASSTQHMQSWLSSVEQPTERFPSKHQQRALAEDDGSFDIHDDFFDEDGDLDEGGFQAWSEHLQSEFVKSPEFKSLPEGEYGFLQCLLQYSVNYLGEMPVTLSVAGLDEILFEVIPRKVMAEPEDAESIVLELNAFFRFVEREYAVANARKLADVLTTKAAKRLKEELSDDSNFGMAKSFFAAGTTGGFDMTTPEGLNRATLAWNARLPKLDDDSEARHDPTVPAAVPTIRREAPRVGRNDPCPCGSGKKYKKCCLQTDG